jgi:hypothetical protein
VLEGASLDGRRADLSGARSAQGCIAQLVEQLTLNQRVAGSNPATPTSHFNVLPVQCARRFLACAHVRAGCSAYFSNQQGAG